MTAVPKSRMTVDEYLAWAVGQPGRYELLDGNVFPTPPENVGHAERKAAVHAALLADIRARGLPCHALPDGITVRVDHATAYVPDAVVYCGNKLPSSAVEVPNPVIVVEVLSPSTAAIDHGPKLMGYFSLPSVEHYLILDPERRVVIHHKRGQGDIIETRILSEGAVRLDPPGIEAPVAEMFPPA
jgi:Uma2 family endonuclease